MAYHVNRPHFASVGHVGATVGLHVQALDLHDAHLPDALRQQVDFGANKIGYLESLLARQTVDFHRPGSGHFGVDLLLHLLGEVNAHVFQLEVHAGRQRLHVAARHQCSVVAPDDTAEDVQRGVGAHQLVAVLPIQHAPDLRAHGRRLDVQLVPHQVALLLDLDHLSLTVIPQQFAAISRLASAAGVEGRTIQRHPGALSRHHCGFELLQIAIGQIEQLGHDYPL